MAAWACGRETAEYLLSLVPGVKNARAREEYRLLETRRYRPEDMTTAIEQLIAGLEGGRNAYGSSWLRPIRSERRNT